MYLAEMQKDKENDTDFHLARIQKILSAVYLKKEPKKINVENYAKKVPTITKEQKKEWIKQGMPSIKKFIKDWKK